MSKNYSPEDETHIPDIRFSGMNEPTQRPRKKAPLPGEYLDPLTQTPILRVPDGVPTLRTPDGIPTLLHGSSKRSFLTFFGLFGILVILAFTITFLIKEQGLDTIAQKATPTVMIMGTVTSSPSVAFQSFIDPAGYFTISYPTAWQESASPITSISGQGTIFTSTDTLPKSVVVLVTPAPLTTDSLPMIIAGEHGTGYAPTRAPVFVALNGVRWNKVEGTFTTSSGQFYHATELVTRAGTHTFVILLIAPQVEYFMTDTTIFTPMLLNFVITK